MNGLNFAHYLAHGDGAQQRLEFISWEISLEKGME